MSTEAEGRSKAEKFRADHHLGDQPLGDLAAVIEQTTGFDVAVLDVGPDEHGLAMRDPARDAVFIGVARTLNPMRQRSTLAHELGHVLFADWVDTREVAWGGKSPTESRANAFARHLLVPLAGLHEFLEGRPGPTLATLSAVVQRFLVSPAVAAIQLCEGRYIDVATKDEWKRHDTPQLAARFGWSDQYGGLQAESNRRRAPQRLLARAINGYAESVLSAQAIATLRGIPLSEVEKDLQEAGVVPEQREVGWADAAELPNADVDLAELDAALSRPDEEGEGDAQDREVR
ncbi:ImmA/IrrE family metallo-endopeptidase [Amycolatopsis sp. NPDC051061]|uniref:ImmA/IrrE family metallo-endopeptidase n=1 Tax=Amycolatopsis sp. NPDC051061 TaxID=3155042 RepID=UPI0034404252